MIPRSVSAHQLRALVDTARGRRPPDVLIRGGQVISVHTEEIVRADVCVVAGRVAHVGEPPTGPGEKTVVVDAHDAFVAPTYIEPHAHPWMLYNPDSLARLVMPWGNTAFVGEMLAVQLLQEPDDVLAIWRELQDTPVRWLWAVRAAGQGHEAATEEFPLDRVEPLLRAPGAVQTAELTGWPQLLAGEGDLLERVALGKQYGLRVDGHGAGASTGKIGALAAAGFTADHESINADDALRRARAGLHVILRESSLRPDLAEFVELCRDPRLAARFSLTTDGAGPTWLCEHGMIDGMVRRLIAAGVPIPRAVAFATLNPATYLRLDEHLGSVTPGRCADLQIIDDFDRSPPRTVLIDGRIWARRGELVGRWPAVDWSRYPARANIDTARAAEPDSYLPREAPGERVPVMRLTSAGIARADEAEAGRDGSVDGAVHTVLWSADGTRVSTGWLRGFADALEGLATTFTTSLGLLVLGRDPRAMARAAAAAYDGDRGGIAVVERGDVSATLRLDTMLTMSSRPVPEVLEDWNRIDAAVRRAGYPFAELLYCLCFITCDFLPDLRLVPDGLLEVKPRRIIRASEPVQRVRHGSRG